MDRDEPFSVRKEPSAELADFPPISYYELIRQQVHHEDDLINHRLSWLIQSQTIFVAAYAAIASAKLPFFQFQLLMILVGSTITVLIWRGVNAAINMMRTSVDLLEKHCPNIFKEGELVPDLRLTDREHRRGISPAKYMPMLFAATWLVIAVEFVYHHFVHTR